MSSSSPPTICASPNFTFPPSSSNSASSSTNSTAAPKSSSNNDYFSLMATSPQSAIPAPSSQPSSQPSSHPPHPSHSSSQPSHFSSSSTQISTNDYFTTNFAKPKLVSSSTNSSLSSDSSVTSSHLSQHHSQTTIQPPNVHKSSYNDSISSINSDTTVYDHHHSSSSISSKNGIARFKRQDHASVSTDTLVDDLSSSSLVGNDKFAFSQQSPSLQQHPQQQQHQQQPKNHLNLKLTVPKHRYNHSLSASFPLNHESFPVDEDDERREELAHKNESGGPGLGASSSNTSPVSYTKASSAVEARFPHHRQSQQNPNDDFFSAATTATTTTSNSSITTTSSQADNDGYFSTTVEKPPVLSQQLSLPPMTLNLAPPPSLKKQNTLPTIPFNHDLTVASIKREQVKRLNQSRQQPSFKNELEQLAPHIIKTLNLEQFLQLFNSVQIDPTTHLPNLLMIDIRPFADYIENHVVDAINVCLPSTLLKRTNFSLKRCINSLPPYDKLIFLNYLANNNEDGSKVTKESNPGGKNGLPAILLYDSYNYSGNLLHMCKKFIDLSCWNEDSQPPIYILDFNFDILSSHHQSILECGKQEKYNVMQPSSCTSSPLQHESTSRPNIDSVTCSTKFRSCSLSEIPTLSTKSTNNTKNVLRNLQMPDCSTPILPNFKLPTNLTSQFKIRHNEEIIDDSIQSLSKDATFKLNYYDPSMILPQWIKRAIEMNSDIIEEFTKLEKFEKKRLNVALGNSVTSTPNTNVNPFFPIVDAPNSQQPIQSQPVSLLSPGGTTVETSPSISFGLDYGHKNRYKDIFLYDHSRVKLNDSGKIQQCDYINASYLNPIDSLPQLLVNTKNAYQQHHLYKKLHYIATQGPLERTIGDFWKVVINHRVPLIISLTDEFEDGVLKCAPFWQAGSYKSNENVIKVEVIESERLCTSKDQVYLTLRMFRLTMDDSTTHEVLQVHLLTWPDMASLLTPRDLLSIIILKNHLMSRLNLESSQYPTLIHCSAGCGRTGTLCTIDSIINVIKFNNNIDDVKDDDDERNVDLKFNPIYSMVNNFRKQRISMVQTLRQYYLIYDTLLIYLAGKKHDWDDLIHLKIVQDFIARQNR